MRRVAILLPTLLISAIVASGCSKAMLNNQRAGILSAPQILGVSPAIGPFTQSTTIAISGSAFQQGLTVDVGGRPCTPVTFHSETLVYCIAPPAPLGRVDIQLTNPDTQIATLDQAFAYVDTVSPVGAGSIVSGGGIAGDANGIVTQSVGVKFSPMIQRDLAATEVLLLSGPQGLQYDPTP